MAYRLARMPRAWFKRASNIRQQRRQAEALQLLADSLKARQITPLIARPDGTLIDGYQRLDAAELAGIPELDAIITDEELTPPQIAAIQFESATLRDDLTGYEKWQALLGIRSAFPGISNKELAARVHYDPGMVTKVLAASACPPQAQEAFAADRLTISEMYAISRSPDPLAATAAALNGASRDELERDRKRRTNGQGRAATVKASRIPVVLPGGLTVTFQADGITLAMALDALADIRKELKDAIDDDHDAKTFNALMKKRARERTRATANAGGAA